MKILTNLILLTSLPLFAFSQEESKTIKINSQEENAYLKGLLNKDFVDGKVIYKDGTYGKAKMDFNVLTSEMLFIAPKGDTLKVLHPESLSMVTIASDTFSFYKSTFILKATHNPSLNLFQRLELKHIDNEKSNGYGYASTSSNYSASSFPTKGGTITNLVDDRELVFRRNTDFLVTNNGVDFYPLKESSFYKLFPQYKLQLKKHFSESNINFNKEDDVINLIDFIQALELSTKP